LEIVVSPPRISVIIPVLNEADGIEEQLTHITGFNGISECLVVDGGSEDGTVAIVERFPQVKLLSGPRGRASQMNAGAREASGDVFLFLHADVRLPNNAPVHIVSALADERVVGGAFRTWTVDDPNHASLGPFLHLADFRSRVSNVAYGDQAIFVRQTAFEALGGFPPMPFMEDYEFSLRLRKLGRVVTVPANVQVSGRRMQSRPVYYFLAINLFPTLYRMGVPTRILGRLYGEPR
jgi:rSAM/selenodomain-associated transferase 2